MTGRFEDGWRAQRVSSGGRVVAVRANHPHAEARLLDPIDYVAPERPGLPPVPGSELLVTARLEDTSQSGFWITHTHGWLEADRSRQIRVYWNICAHGAPALVAATTAGFGESPYALKMLATASAYARTDAAVIYIPADRLAELAGPIREVHAAIAERFLAPRTPALTRQLLPGVGVADDPGDGRSFGEDRCRLVAEGIVAAFARGMEATPAVIETIGRRFAARGLALARPHLNASSEADHAL